MDIPSVDYLLDETAKNSQPIWQVLLREEQADTGESQEAILERALHTYDVMKNAAMSGIASDMKSVSGLTGGDAAQYYNHLRNHKSLLGSLEAKAVAYALGTSGYNAAMGVVVASSPLEGRREKVMNAIVRAVKPDSVFIEDELALIAVVGRGMVKAKGTSARVCDALARADINIRIIDQGSSELNIIVGVDDEEYEDALRAIYAEFVKA